MGVEGGDEEQWEAESQQQGSNPRQEKIFVTVRLRPLNPKENESNDFADWECINTDTILFKNCLGERSMYPNAYTFDRVFGFGSSTRQVYEEAAKKVALSVLNGINSSVFAYGQTSSGKTYTMNGITQCAITDIFDYIYKHAEREYVVKFGAMEIYNEHVKDLLSIDPSPLRLLDDPERGTVVERLTEETVKDKSHLLELIAVCEAQRQIGETSLNETSSRSHQILRLTIESSPRQLVRGNSSMLTASVNFVDLAGSERTSQTLASGTRLKEGSHINRSLLTLGKCIRSLSKGRNGHVPYRDSKLTRILQNSLGGNARTAIICTMSPAHSHLEQSRNTLLFACCAKQVTTNAQVNVVMSDKALVKHLRKELARLERELGSMPVVSSKGDVVAVLKEKELQIEKMDMEIKELSRQRDIAQLRLEEMLNSGDSGSQSQTSESRRTLSWFDDFSLTSDVSDYQRLELELASSESLKFLQEKEGFDLICNHRELLENFDDSLLPETPKLPSHTTPAQSARPSDHQSPRWEDLTTIRRPDEEIEDYCKEVQCIEELEDPKKILPLEEEKQDKKEKDFNLEETKNEKENEIECSKLTENENKSHDNKAEYDALVKRIKELQVTIDLLVSHNAKLEEPSSGTTRRSLNFNRSRSCKAIMTNTYSSSPMAENVVRHHRDQSFGGFDKLKIPERAKCLPRVRDVNSEGNRELSRLSNSASMKNPILDERQEDVMCSEINDTPELSSSDVKTDIDTTTEADKPMGHEVNGTLAVEVNEQKENKSVENVGDDEESGELVGDDEAESVESVADDAAESVESVADDAAESVESVADDAVKSGESVEDDADKYKESKRDDAVDNHQLRNCISEGALTTTPRPISWQEEFESQQCKIIELWHDCHIPLVHRTYFFLLFKGDPSDTVYLDVELRRLSFIKNRFSQGQKIVLDGQAFNQSSSLKGLNQEREMLVKQMYKRIPTQDRDTLFKKWGIDVNGKQRRLQLARRIWTDPNSMQHIKESASLVARLMDFTDESQVPKEMFVGPSITPKTFSRMSYSWKAGMSSIA